MIFLFGVRTKAKPITQQERACTKCVRPTMHAIVETRKWFTLFFIPVIPFSRNIYSRCGVCGLTSKCTAELKDQVSTMAMAAKA
jgi:hypothetical protein